MIGRGVYNGGGVMEDSFIPNGDIKRMASIIMKTFIRFFRVESPVIQRLRHVLISRKGE